MTKPVSDESPGPQGSTPTPRRSKSVLRSFRFAWEGLSFVFNTQRHMRVHVYIVTLLLIAAWGLEVTTYELLHLLTAFALVLITEMINTAIEQTIDLTVKTYDPRAKVAKDVAAGAVMIAAAYAVAVGTIGIASSETFWDAIHRIPHAHPDPQVGPVQTVLIGSILVAIIITWIKRRTSGRSLWGTGIISGHTALGFLVATGITIITRNPAITCLALALALLVAQSRVQSRIHSPLEVVFGGVLGIAVGVVVFLPTVLSVD